MSPARVGRALLVVPTPAAKMRSSALHHLRLRRRRIASLPPRLRLPLLRLRHLQFRRRMDTSIGGLPAVIGVRLVLGALAQSPLGMFVWSSIQMQSTCLPFAFGNGRTSFGGTIICALTVSPTRKNRFPWHPTLLWTWRARPNACLRQMVSIKPCGRRSRPSSSACTELQGASRVQQPVLQVEQPVLQVGQQSDSPGFQRDGYQQR